MDMDKDCAILLRSSYDYYYYDDDSLVELESGNCDRGKGR